jgi:hypothetical protein
MTDIKLIPTWRAAMQIFIMALENGTEQGKESARTELMALADQVDARNTKESLSGTVHYPGKDQVYFGVTVDAQRAEYLSKCLDAPLCKGCGREEAECSADPCVDVQHFPAEELQRCDTCRDTFDPKALVDGFCRECAPVLHCNQDTDIRHQLIRDIANDLVTSNELEIDEGAIVSEGDDNGVFVQAWVWVDFSGTELDKDKEISL